MTERQRPVATTIVDVARAAKVSRATASRALAGYGRVRPATREKVLALAAELDYRPNTLARAVRAGRSAVIGLIVTDIANPFLAQLTKAVAGTAVELGYDLLIAETNEDQEAERRATRVFVEKRVDGLIVVPAAGHSHDHRLWASSHGAPLVLLDRSPRGSGLTSVTSDDYRSACEAVELLVGKGHSRIATITATWLGAGFSRRRPAALFSSAAGRVDGFRAGMKRAGLVPRPEWVLYASVADPSALRAAAASRSLGDEYYATDGLCTHERTPLADGLVMGYVIECPKHNGRFDDRTGEGKGAPICINLTTYPVKVEGGVIYIDVA